MGKIVEWFLNLTKVGKAVNSVREKLRGYKAYIAGAAMVIPALLTIIQGFTDGGTSYLLTVTHTEAYRLLLEGLSVMGLRAAIAKT